MKRGNGIPPFLFPPGWLVKRLDAFFKTNVPRAILKWAGCCALLAGCVFYPEQMSLREFPVFRVVLDPGHGGIAAGDWRKHGDRYDAISGAYLQVFKEGASYGSLEEHVIVNSIAKKAARILENCGPGGDFSRFYPHLEKFTALPYDRISIVCMLSRGDSIGRKSKARRKDPNEGFRIFDFPGPDGEMRPGRLSRINAFRPQLVVSLHSTKKGSAYFRGMNPVIVPPHGFLLNGLLYLQGSVKSRRFFFSSPYGDWFEESDERSGYEWFLNDVMIYFTGYPLNRDRSVQREEFKGYRYNMVTWSYHDDDGWERDARSHRDDTPYAASAKGFAARGRFWERERSIHENYRRDGGMEGFGGDNHYASSEIIRYILMSLRLRGIYSYEQRLGRPYVSVWHMPIHMNAVSAFIEMGYLDRAHFRYLLTRRQDEIAEGIAVGIYSLLSGIRPKTTGSEGAPRGKRIDLKKYALSSNKSYFDAVVRE